MQLKPKKGYNKTMKTILVDAANTFTVNGEIHIELHQLLEMYSNKKIIVTNANDEQLIAFGLINLPYELFTLKHNPDKVNPEYFILLLEKFNLKNDEVVYFEHNLEAVKSAVSLGIHTYHYDVEKRDLEALRKFLDSSL